MEIEIVRDWVIVIQGIFWIILVLGFIILVLVLYGKINNLIKKGKDTVARMEQAFSSPYYQVGSWVLRAVAAGLGTMSGEKPKGRKK